MSDLSEVMDTIKNLCFRNNDGSTETRRGDFADNSLNSSHGVRGKNNDLLSRPISLGDSISSGEMSSTVLCNKNTDSSGGPSSNSSTVEGNTNVTNTLGKSINSIIKPGDDWRCPNRPESDIDTRNDDTTSSSGSSDDSSTTDESTTNTDDSDSIGEKNIYDYYDRKRLARLYSSYPTPIILDDMYDRHIFHLHHDKKSFNWGILGLGVSNFMSYAAHFCKCEGGSSVEVISVGSGDGIVDDTIMRTYRCHFAPDELKITLVDPKWINKANFKTVDDLIEKCPNVVRNCVTLIIWPDPMEKNKGYDIEAIRKLQPRAALALYEPREVSGSMEFTEFLRRETNEREGFSGLYRRRSTNFGLENYTVELVASQEVHLKAGKVHHTSYSKWITKPGMCAYSLRLVKLKRMD